MNWFFAHFSIVGDRLIEDPMSRVTRVKPCVIALSLFIFFKYERVDYTQVLSRHFFISPGLFLNIKQTVQRVQAP